MKILICTFTFAPNKDGVAAAAGAMAQGFVERGWDVSVATGFSPERQDFRPHRNLTIHQFRIEASPGSPSGFRGEVEQYREFLALGDWDVAFFHSWGLWPSELALSSFQGKRAKLVMVSHGFGGHKVSWQRRFPWGLWTWLLRLPSIVRFPWTMRNYHAVVFLTGQPDFDAFCDLKVARLTRYPGIRVIPNGVDPFEVSQDGEKFRKNLGIPSLAKLFVCVANYSHRKNQGFAVRAFRRARLGETHLVFIGSEFNQDSQSFRNEDRELATTFPQGCVHWLEGLDRPATLAAIAAADCAVLSARHEAQPIFLLEAMRAGKPWIALKAGCIASMEGGLCVRSEMEMSAAMGRIVESSTLREKLGEEGKTAVLSLYNRDNYVSSYARLVEELTRASVLSPSAGK